MPAVAGFVAGRLREVPGKYKSLKKSVFLVNRNLQACLLDNGPVYPARVVLFRTMSSALPLGVGEGFGGVQWGDTVRGIWLV